jgi:hypothetical protein
MRIRALCCGALVLGLLAGPVLADTFTVPIEVWVSPAYQSVPLSNGTAVIDILANIPEDRAIEGFGIDLTIGGAMNVSYTALDVVIGPLFDQAFAPDGDGLAGLVQPPAQVWGTDILLATITLQLNAVGLASLTPGDSNPWPGLGDLTEGFINGGFEPVNYTAGAIQVTPEPASLALLAVALVLRRR